MSDKTTVALLLGRKGSSGFPGKNSMTILGRPAFTYPIMAAKNSRFVDHIFVSTDHEGIIAAAPEMGVEVIERPEELANDEALFEDALEHGYFEVVSRLGKAPDYVVVLMCNAVTINAALIDEAIEKLEANPEADSAVTVSVFDMYSPLRARKLGEDGYLKPFVPFEAFGDPKTLSCDRRSQGTSYFADMSHTVCRGECIANMAEGLLPQRWMGQNILPVVNGDGCDIDERWQLDMSINWLKDHGFSEGDTPYED
ncbi:cytidylyltransferase domain-containing protein [Desulfovibrio ferrophilus]|uniref:Cytidylyltransferase domain protein n=1 Tax=Desulfovibrio ferrophilus TaxID=241368 RepID=A0A2Z6B0B6_9BACT|nr:cytidylyltransferase [Desulfovibrio ferrophilus]BBD08913.1 cytidylyltransferase domain protein [Desulfovibrio ferrophilus]